MAGGGGMVTAAGWAELSAFVTLAGVGGLMSIASLVGRHAVTRAKVWRADRWPGDDSVTDQLWRPTVSDRLRS